MRTTRLKTPEATCATTRMTTRMVTAALLTGAALLGPAATALADTSTPSPTPSPGSSESAAPTEAGTAFRTATAIKQGQPATAAASTGDYLYWMFPAAAGQTATAKATVTLPDQATRHGAETWQLDVYDGLRRRQPCVAGDRTARSPDSGPSVTLTCTLRTVRPIADSRSNDPLPGAYYVRLTVVDLPAQDLGLPFKTEVVATAKDAGGAHSEGGELAAPLTPAGQSGVLAAPDGGWTAGWWSDRWLWTAGGGVLGALAAIGGYTLTRGPRLPRRAAAQAR
ncbi:hypothetical protein QMK19_27660 [Streptomyces sp. H10-C2]|uniref:hypothetical protein n=1 Tax=unclassified Streptomyces TaxID=2593676 RepID=UPI0024BB01B5|nr:MULTISPECIES: hypothetical protein [unclassified Streptomyces]MDJ0343889.1 hypothetical protein [Streptomyces sp. PH10-H1]MDJ0373330.1 hypothetical protein [Streptomyces sp. H10-C2]